MKKWNIYEIAFIILVVVLSYILILTFTGMFISKIPTTADNKEIRQEILQLVSGLESIIFTVIGYKLRDLTDNKNENK